MFELKPCPECGGVATSTKRTGLASRKNVPLAAAEKCLGLISCFVLHAKRTEALSDEAD